AWTHGGPLEYRMLAETHFEDGGPWPGPPLYRGNWTKSRSLELAVHPLSGCPRVEVELSPGGLNFDETPQVQVDVRAAGEAFATQTLTREAPSVVLRRRFDADG